MKHEIIITMTDILNAEHWEQPIHLAAKKGLPVKYANKFIMDSIDFDWNKVENVSMWEDKMNSELIFEWEDI